VKLLFDENLSPRLVSLLASEFPGCSQIELLGMRGATDTLVWQHAKANDFIIVSKDNDFRQRVFLLGPPPKVIWLDLGNTSTKAVAALLLSNLERIRPFVSSLGEGLLILP